MKVDIKVPNAGESVQEAMIIAWHKKNGQQVMIDDLLVELDTDKASIEVHAEKEGVLNIMKEPQETVKIGEVIAQIDTEGVASVSDAAAPISIPSKKNETLENMEEASKSEKEEVSEKKTEEPILSPAAKRISEEHQLDHFSIEGHGKGGRIMKEDVIAKIEEEKTAAPLPCPSEKVEKRGTKEIPLKKKEEQKGKQVRKPMSMLRRRIAERLVQAQQNSAIVTTFNEIDMSSVMEVRKKYKELFQKKYEVSLGFMSFFTKASIEALRVFPLLNGQIDGNDLILNEYYDISIAVSSKKGLIVPVIRNAESLNFVEIEKQILDFVEKAGKNALSLAELEGGTFTISNGGVFGSMLSTPMLNPPQSAILGLHKIEKRPVVIGNQIEIRPMMYLALSYDHRIVDGKEAVQFLVKVKECIEDPIRLLLEV